MEQQSTYSPQNHYNIYVKVTEINKTVFTEQTGEFPVTSIREKKYLTIMCDENSNKKLAGPIKTKNKRKC